MKYLWILLAFIPITGFSQTEEKEDVFYITPKISWKDQIQAIQYFGMEAYGNSGNLYKSAHTDLWKDNSFSWELYYVASIPKYNWISFGSGLEVTGTVERDPTDGTVFDRQLLEGFLFVFQAYMNVSPWFTLHANSLGKIEFQFRYNASFRNPVDGNFGHFLLTEVIFGFFLTGNQVAEVDGSIDKFWIASPSIEFLYYIQFHEHVAFRWFTKLYLNNGLFYESGIIPSQTIPIDLYARFDFIVGNGITLWVRAQWNIANTDFSDAALFQTRNSFDIQLRAGLILIVDFLKKPSRT
ncbi:MAG: hypothetical protein ACRCWI_07410 [Brevinema sp.]